MQQQRAWELLRKEARKLESEIDSKLATDAKYDKCYSYRQSDPASSEGYSSSVQAAQVEDLLLNIEATVLLVHDPASNHVV